MEIPVLLTSQPTPTEGQVQGQPPMGNPDPAAMAGQSPTPDSTQEAPISATQPPSFWQVTASTFITIFLAELGDKTQVTTLLMSAESQSPWVVFTGASLALVLTSLLGVLLGTWLAKRVAPKVLDTAAGALLLLIAIWLLWDVVNL